MAKEPLEIIVEALLQEAAVKESAVQQLLEDYADGEAYALAQETAALLKEKISPKVAEQIISMAANSVPEMADEMFTDALKAAKYGKKFDPALVSEQAMLNSAIAVITLDLLENPDRLNELEEYISPTAFTGRSLNTGMDDKLLGTPLINSTGNFKNTVTGEIENQARFRELELEHRVASLIEKDGPVAVAESMGLASDALVEPQQLLLSSRQPGKATLLN